jgi:hypothetical protein
MVFIIDELNPKEKTMTQDAKPNRRTRRLLERGYVMPQGVSTSWNPMDRARGLRHKKPYQHKQAAKALADHGVSR